MKTLNALDTLKSVHQIIRRAQAEIQHRLHCLEEGVKTGALTNEQIVAQITEIKDFLSLIAQ